MERPEDVRLIERYVRAFNHGVSTGDWEPMLRHLAPDAEMRFPHASYRGLEEIRAAYAVGAPDDQVVPLGVQEDVVAFAWANGGGTGRMLFEIERGLVTRLTVAFDER